MKMVILYHPMSEYALMVETYARDFERMQSIVPELVSLETKEGANLAKVYDVVRYPAIIVTRDDGAHLKQWEGEELPLMSEVAGYFR